MHSACGCMQSHCSVLLLDNAYRMITPFAMRCSETVPSGKVHTRQNKGTYQQPITKGNAHRSAYLLSDVWARHLESISSPCQASPTMLIVNIWRERNSPANIKLCRLLTQNRNGSPYETTINSNARAGNMAGMTPYGRAVTA